jgi:hypothetical protein
MVSDFHMPVKLTSCKINKDSQNQFIENSLTLCNYHKVSAVSGMAKSTEEHKGTAYIDYTGEKARLFPPTRHKVENKKDDGGAF